MRRKNERFTDAVRHRPGLSVGARPGRARLASPLRFRRGAGAGGPAQPGGVASQTPRRIISMILNSHVWIRSRGNLNR